MIIEYPVRAEINASVDDLYDDLELLVGEPDGSGLTPIRVLVVHDRDDGHKLRVMVWEDRHEDDPHYWFQIDLKTGERMRITESPHASGEPEIESLRDRTRITHTWTPITELA